MPQRFRRFSVGQAAKMFGVVYVIIGVAVLPLFWIMAKVTPDAAPFSLGFLLLLPILYGGAGFVFTAIGCWIYGCVAAWAGGIEFELADAPQV